MNVYNKKDLVEKVYFSKPAFFIGELINGILILETQMSSVIERIAIEISMAQEWKIEPNVPTYYSQKLGTFNLDLTHVEDLKKIDTSYSMQAGQNIIPFNLKLEQVEYPSFEFPLENKHAFVRYYFDIKIFSYNFKQTS